MLSVSKLNRFLIFVITFLLAGTTSFCQGVFAETPVRIVIDSIHAHNALGVPDEADYYSYHNNYGYRHAFDFLKSRGVKVDELTSGTLSAEKLAGSQMLFINLVSADLPLFSVPEIAAIKAYIESGGSLFVITDHSNCYFHAYKLGPLMEQLGLQVTTETAADRAPATLGPGNGWLAITRFSEHPVTKGLQTVAFETGGTVDEQNAIATTSPKAWGDQWQHQPYGQSDDKLPGPAPGFFGNWQQDEGERSGALPVIAAKTLGKGRIVVVGDQNIFGDPFINYADNYKLWLNAVSWLTGDAALADAGAYFNWNKSRVLAYDNYSKAAFGDSSIGGSYNVFVALGRKFWILANDNLDGDADVLLFARAGDQLPPKALENTIKHLRALKSIVVLGSKRTAEEAEPGLLFQLQKVLGAAPARQMRYHDLPAQYYQWPGCGRVLVLPENLSYRNDAMADPEKQPAGQQLLALNELMHLLQVQMR